MTSWRSHQGRLRALAIVAATQIGALWACVGDPPNAVIKDDDDPSVDGSIPNQDSSNPNFNDSSVGADTNTGGGDDAGSDAASSDDAETLTDANAPSDSGSADANADIDVFVPPPAVISPLTSTGIVNAINPYGIVFANDGFIYVTGATNDGGVNKLAVWRFNTSGTLEAGFGSGGMMKLEFGGVPITGVWDIAEISAGKFVVLFQTSGRVYLVRLGPAFAWGTPMELKFGWDNLADPAWPGPNPISYTTWGMGIDRSTPATPKIVVFAHGAPAKVATGTQRTDNDRWITRVSAETLALDPTFNGGKPFSFDADNQGVGDNARRGLVLADGSIVSGGYTNLPGGNTIILKRLLSDGTPDSTFGFGTTGLISGEVRFNPYAAVGGFAESYALGRQSTGVIVSAGYGIANTPMTSVNVDATLTGITATGADPTFGTGTSGTTAVQSEGDPAAGTGPSPYNDRCRDLAMLPDDRIAAGGVYDNNAAVFVFDKKGKLDPTSGQGGVVKYAHAANIFRIVLSPDGKRLAATTQSLASPTGDASAPFSSRLFLLQVGP